MEGRETGLLRDRRMEDLKNTGGAKTNFIMAPTINQVDFFKTDFVNDNNQGVVRTTKRHDVRRCRRHWYSSFFANTRSSGELSRSPTTCVAGSENCRWAIRHLGSLVSVDDRCVFRRRSNSRHSNV